MPEAKGKPARVNIYPYPNASGKPIAAKSFYKAQEVDIRWSPAGLAVLIFTHTDVDATGGSYYGSTGLFLLHASVGSDGTAFDCAVPLPKEGPIGDAQWSPTGREFIVIAGATRSLLRGARLCVSRTFAARPTQNCSALLNHKNYALPIEIRKQNMCLSLIAALGRCQAVF